jgi:integrase
MNLNVKTYNRAGVLYVDFNIKSKRYQRSTRLKDNKTNRRIIDTKLKPIIIEGILKNRVPELFKKDEYSESVYYYLDKVIAQSKSQKHGTQRIYKIAIDKFKTMFKNRNLATITSKDFQKYVDTLVDSGYSKSSIKIYIAPISKAFSLALKDDLILKKPSFSINKKDDKKQKEIFTIDEIKQLLYHATGYLKTYLHIAIYTGFRASEILALKWQNIDFDNNIISVESAVYEGIESLPKGNKKFTTPLNKNLKDYLLPIKKDYGFIVTSKNSYIKSSTSINTSMKMLQKELNFSKILTTHSIRHTFVSLMLKSNESKSLVKQFTSHSDYTMIDEIYTHYISDSKDMVNFNKLFT